MTDSLRVEIVARALARYRLGHYALANGLPSDTARSILDQAIEKLWPSLREEAQVVIAALDGAPPAPQRSPGEPPAPSDASAGPNGDGAAGEARGRRRQDRERESSAFESDDVLVNPLGRSYL